MLDYAREKGLDVVFTGMVPHGEVADYYRLGDLFVTASTSETQGLTYFEGLGAAAPKASAENFSDDSRAADRIRSRSALSPQKLDRHRPKSSPLSYCQPLMPSSTTPADGVGRGRPAGRPLCVSKNHPFCQGKGRKNEEMPQKAPGQTTPEVLAAVVLPAVDAVLDDPVHAGVPPA